MEAGGCVCIVCVQHELCMTEATLLDYNDDTQLWKVRCDGGPDARVLEFPPNELISVAPTKVVLLAL